MEKRIELGRIYGKIKRLIWENGKRIILKDMGFINMWMEDNIRENGKIIKCMVLENLFGLKEKNMLDFINMIKNKDFERRKIKSS